MIGLATVVITRAVHAVDVAKRVAAALIVGFDVVATVAISPGEAAPNGLDVGKSAHTIRTITASIPIIFFVSIFILLDSFLAWPRPRIL